MLSVLRATPPSAKVTEPVGVDEPPATEAVKVTGWPTTEGLAEENSAVLVAAGRQLVMAQYTSSTPPLRTLPASEETGWTLLTMAALRSDADMSAWASSNA